MKMNLTKKDFSCWGNGDKYDDELFIEHDPKITAVEIADEILKNQSIVERLKKLLHKKKKDYKYAKTKYHVGDISWEDIETILEDK